MALPRLPTLGTPKLSYDLLGVGDPGGGIATPRGPNYGIDFSIPTGSGSTTPAPASSAGVKETIQATGSLISCLMSPTSCLLRLVLLLIGLICIAGAIYLFKPVNQIVSPVVKSKVKETVEAIAA